MKKEGTIVSTGPLCWEAWENYETAFLLNRKLVKSGYFMSAGGEDTARIILSAEDVVKAFTYLDKKLYGTALHLFASLDEFVQAVGKNYDFSLSIVNSKDSLLVMFGSVRGSSKSLVAVEDDAHINSVVTFVIQPDWAWVKPEMDLSNPATRCLADNITRANQLLLGSERSLFLGKVFDIFGKLAEKQLNLKQGF